MPARTIDRCPQIILGTIICCMMNSSLSANDVRFNEDIRPIFAEYCVACHGPDAAKRSADLQILDQDSAYQIAIDLKAPSESLLLARITSADAAEIMPPPSTGKHLSPKQIEKISKWIEGGAKYETHWSFLPIGNKQQAAPESTGSQTNAGKIDLFLNEALKAQGLSMRETASRETLIRRATFDLHGLPPTIEEVESFVADQSDNAYDNVIDRLLASPRYGERWARYWLDLARYADTHGGSAIDFTTFPFSYTYRNYVIQAFNSDLPYDRFLREQIAADQLDLAEDDSHLAALGFLTVGMQFRNYHDTIDDQIDVITRGLMGMTVSCARCHDHKFDAISTKDYYSLYAVLAASRRPATLPIIGSSGNEAERNQYYVELEQLQRQRLDMARDQVAVMKSRLRMQVDLYLKEISKGTPEFDLSTEFLSYRTDDIRPLIYNRWLDYLAKLNDTDPAFGPWKQLSRITENDGNLFHSQALAKVDAWIAENGPDAPNQHNIAAAVPRWNPRVLQKLKESKLELIGDVAAVYGDLFRSVNQEWLDVLQRATREATSPEAIVPDEDASHELINSPIHSQLRYHLFSSASPVSIDDDAGAGLLNRPINDNLERRRSLIHQLHLSSPGSPPRAMALEENISDKKFFIFVRGNPLSRGEPVEPRFPLAIDPTLSPFDTKHVRGQLADAIVSSNNPLTRRVIVNWIWMHHFGEGIVRTVDDFGTRGRTPTHPQLLDFLAESLSSNGWSLKQLHRSIMLTEAYRQSSTEDESLRAKDPDIELLWRARRMRLDFESMRDSMLYVSGELNVEGVDRPFDLQANPANTHRSIYGFINRDIISNLVSTFDGASPTVCTAKRPETTVPQQTLFALNSQFIQDRAMRIAENCIQAVNRDQVVAPKVGNSVFTATSREADESQTVEWLFRKILSRKPTADEIELSTKFLRDSQQLSNQMADAKQASEEAVPSVSKKSIQQLAHVLLASNEFVFVD